MAWCRTALVPEKLGSATDGKFGDSSSDSGRFPCVMTCVMCYALSVVCVTFCWNGGRCNDAKSCVANSTVRPCSVR